MPTNAPHRDTSQKPGPLLRRIAVALPAVLALLYALGHLGWYLGTPLGRVPVLDERENLDLAGAIAGRSLPPEPFYRAPGYALVLAGLRAAGVSAGRPLPRRAPPRGGAPRGQRRACRRARPPLVRKRRRRSPRALLFALDPVLVHYATQALDATFALTLFLAGLDRLAAAVAAPGRTGAWAGAGAAWAAATLARANYLLAWATLPCLAALRGGPKGAGARILAPTLAGLALFGAACAWQWSVSGVAGFLPWQGAYNLWAANRPGANGRFYTQQVTLSAAERARQPRPRGVDPPLLPGDGGGPADIPL